MHTRPHRKPGYFDTTPGTCLIIPDLPYPNGDYPENGYNGHPFVVISDNDEAVECVMATTVSCRAENKNGRWKLFELDYALELKKPCPPLDPLNYREQIVNMQGVVTVPKKVLYESTDIKICDRDGLVMDQGEVRRIRNAVSKYGVDHPEDSYMPDPYHYYDDGDFDWSVDEWLPKTKAKARTETARPLPDTAGIKTEPESSRTGPEI